MPDPSPAKLGDLAAAAGVARVHVLAWRDLDDVEAGGAEALVDHITRRWAAAGIEVAVRTSFAQNHPPVTRREGVEVIRRGGRYLVVPRATVAELAGHHGRADARLEVWSGMPFWTPLWSRGRAASLVLHHYQDVWERALPPRLARLGRLTERRVVPLAYRRRPIVTLAASTRDELVRRLGLPYGRITVVPPGVEARFSPGGERATAPTVLAVGRLVPWKRHDRLLRAAALVRQHVPGLRVEIVGDGYERDALRRMVADAGAEDWIELAGRVDDGELLERYRRAWVVASASEVEGWGLTLTEAGACGTPAVATRIPGHCDAVLDGQTGLLVDGVAGLVEGLVRILTDRPLAQRMGHQARVVAAERSWDATALGVFGALVGIDPAAPR